MAKKKTARKAVHKKKQNDYTHWLPVVFFIAALVLFMIYFQNPGSF